MEQHEVQFPSDFAPPDLSADEVMDIAYTLYGLSGDFKRFTSERDQVVYVNGGPGSEYILRISGEGEPVPMLEFQNWILSYIKARDARLPVPECLPSRNGRLLEAVSGTSYNVRLMTYVAGTPTLGRRRSAALRRDIGSHLARLDLAMRGILCAPRHDNLLWDIRGAGNVRQLTKFVSDADGRKLVERTLDDLILIGLPQLDKFDQQVIHNDFNPKNVLTAVGAPDRVSGIIDFGDIISGTRIIDVGVAIARHMETANAVQCAYDIVEGYNRESQLSEHELATLFLVICGRLAIRTAVWSWRYSLGDKRADPQEIRDALLCLDILYSVGASEVTSMFREACKSQARTRPSYGATHP